MNRYRQIIFAFLFGTLLLGCTPVEVTPTTPATAAAPVQITRETPTATNRPPTWPPPATQLLPTETSAPTATSAPTPTATIPPFTFQGTIVLSILPNWEANESVLWLLPYPYIEVQQLLSEEGVIFGQPLLSPTGRYLAYQRDVGDSTSIWVLDMTTGETKQWSENFEYIYMDLQGSPHLLNGIKIQSWTPDEKALVFQYWEEQVALDEPVWSYILFEDGRTQQLGSRILDVSWSANEPNNLVYLSEFGRIYLTDTNQIETSTQLLQEVAVSFVGTLSWHPGGQYIAIAGNRGNDVPLWMLDLQTMQLKEIWYGEAGFQQVRWSPDGEWLLWQSGDLTSLLSFSEENFTQPATIQRLPSSLKSRENPWLPSSNFVGLLSDSLDYSPAKFCLYSILGEQVGCLFKIDGVVNQLGLDESSLSIAITWTP